MKGGADVAAGSGEPWDALAGDWENDKIKEYRSMTSKATWPLSLGWIEVRSRLFPQRGSYFENILGRRDPNFPGAILACICGDEVRKSYNPGGQVPGDVQNRVTSELQKAGPVKITCVGFTTVADATSKGFVHDEKMTGDKTSFGRLMPSAADAMIGQHLGRAQPSPTDARIGQDTKEVYEIKIEISDGEPVFIYKSFQQILNLRPILELIVQKCQMGEQPLPKTTSAGRRYKMQYYKEFAKRRLTMSGQKSEGLLLDHFGKYTDPMQMARSVTDISLGGQGKHGIFEPNNGGDDGYKRVMLQGLFQEIPELKKNLTNMRSDAPAQRQVKINEFFLALSDWLNYMRTITGVDLLQGVDDPGFNEEWVRRAPSHWSRDAHGSVTQDKLLHTRAHLDGELREATKHKLGPVSLDYDYDYVCVDQDYHHRAKDDARKKSGESGEAGAYTMTVAEFFGYTTSLEGLNIDDHFAALFALPDTDRERFIRKEGQQRRLKFSTIQVTEQDKEFSEVNGGKSRRLEEREMQLDKNLQAASSVISAYAEQAGREAVISQIPREAGTAA